MTPADDGAASALRYTRLRSFAAAALIVLLTFALYAQVRTHGFVEFDDPIYITENPNLAQPLDRDTVVRLFREPYETNWIPLTWLSFHVDRALFGLAPAGTHLLNVSLHAASAALLYLALFGLSGAFLPSLFVAAVFAVHPLHVESVAWASERKDTLSGLFFMLSLLAYTRYAKRRSPGAYSLLLAVFTLGLLAKPMLVSLPLVLLLLDLWPLARLRGDDGRFDRRRLAQRCVEKLPLVAIAVAVAAVTYVVQGDAGAMASEHQVTIPSRLANALTSYWSYLADSLWPSGLTIFYPYPAAGSSLLPAAAAGIGLLAVTAFALHHASERPHLLVGWSWFLVMLLPVIGLVQVGMQARADRYMYLPQIGLTLAIAWEARRWTQQSDSIRMVVRGAALIAILALTIVSYRQIDHWRDTSALFEHALEVDDDNFIAHQAVAIEFLAAGSPRRAEHHFGRAVQLKPRWPEAHIGLGDARFAQGRVEESIDDYKRGVELAPRKPAGHIHLARALAESGKPTAAEHHFRRAIELGRDSPNAAAHAYLALLFSRTGRVPQAEAQYRKALEIDPSYGEAHANLGFLLIREKRPAEAKVALDRAVALGHESAELHFGLGVLELQADQAAAAVRHFRSALERRPDWNLPANNLAWLLATHPDPAIRDPIAAIEIAEGLRREGEPLKPRKLDTLAAAYAAAGRFAEASLTAGAAAQLARKAGDEELAARIERREQLYRSRRPFLESPRPRID